MNYGKMTHTILAKSADDSPIYWKLFHLKADLDYWTSYTFQGLRNEISGHSRKDQRTYQRKFCSALSRRNSFIDSNLEFFL